jgi:hypothetical protein
VDSGKWAVTGASLLGDNGCLLRIGASIVIPDSQEVGIKKSGLKNSKDRLGSLRTTEGGEQLQEIT